MDADSIPDDGLGLNVRRTTDGGIKRSRSDYLEDDSLLVSQEASKRVAIAGIGVSAVNEPAREHPETSEVTPDATAVPSESDTPSLDENGRVPGYDASKELFPPCGFYRPAFGLAEDIVTRVCDIVSDAYGEAKRSGYHNEAIENVCGSSGLAACRKPSYLYPVPGSVAVLGPAGSGKSSATNSIMSQKKVAFEHDGDDRGTYLVHEYRSALPDQLSKYRVVATYYSRQDIMRDCIAHYFHMNAKIFDDSDEPSDDNESAFEQRYRTALCFFTHLLAHRQEFQTEASTVKYFEDHGDDEAPTVCQELIGFVDEFLDSRDAYHDGEEFYNVNSELELQGVFKRVCRPPKARSLASKEGSPWPIIRKVVVHQDVAILNSGVVLADTPGFNDQNLAVVQNTMRYLKVAGTVLIFLTYKRIDNNSPLDQLLRECISLGKMHNIRLVVTTIDEMKPLDADDLDAEGSARLKTAEVNLQRTLSEIRETEAAKKQAKGVNSVIFEQMDGRLETLQLAKVQAAAAVKQVNISIRCREMRKNLRGRIQAIDKSRYAPELPISFISNTQYQLHVNGYDPNDADPKETPFLNLKATGIQQLRQELLTIPTHGKLQILKGLVTNRLPNILNGITGILTKSKLERIAEVRKIMDKVFLKHHEPVVSLTTSICQAFEKQVTGTITKSLPEWRDEAQKAVNKWAEMNPMTFKGFCSRGGLWECHKNHGGASWKGDLVNVSAGKLSLAFNKLDTDLDGIKKDFSLGVQDLFDGVCAEIKNSKDAQGNVLGPFFAFVNGTAIEIVELVLDEFDELKGKIDQSRYAATLDSATSYFVKGMEATYEEAARLSSRTYNAVDLPPATLSNAGSRTRKRRSKKSTVSYGRVEIILNKVRGETGQKSIFLSVGQLCKDDLAAYMKIWAVRCDAIIEKGYRKIIDYFDNHFQEEEVKEEEDPVAVNLIMNAVEKALEHLKDAEPYLTECEAYEKGAKHEFAF